MRELLTTALIALAIGQANAASASPESIEELLVATKSEAMMDSMYRNVGQIMRQSMQKVVAGKLLAPEQQQILDALPGKFVAVMRTELTWDALKPQYVQLYRETFDQEEIDGLLAFYRSTAGQAFVNMMPTVLQKSMAISQSRMQTLLPRMRAAIEQALAEAKLTR